MSARCRTDILKAYTYFSPASVDVIARIEHMEQVPDLSVYCLQLHEDGLLERVYGPNNIVEFQLSRTGHAVTDNDHLNVPSTKITIYNQLRAKERKHAAVRDEILTIIQSCNRFVCLLELQHLYDAPITVPELSSVLYGLLYTKTIVTCGPLYGICHTITESPSDHDLVSVTYDR